MNKIKLLKIILCIILLLILGFIFFTKNIEPFNTSHKYAFCMWGELRGITSTSDSLYKNVIKPLNADVFICCQKTGKDIDNNISLFKDNIVDKQLYDKPNLNDVYKHLDAIENKGNFRIDSNLQMYYNFYKINKLYGKLFETEYDYIILSRSDFLHIFEFPNISNLTKNDDIIWSYDEHDYGGINMCLLVVPAKYIVRYLTSTYNYLNDESNIDKLNRLDLNNEKLYKLYFNENNWKIGKIQNNAFITCDSDKEITTWGEIKYSDKYNVYYKYEYQMNNSYESYEQYKNGDTWTYKYSDIDRIILSKPSKV